MSMGFARDRLLVALVESEWDAAAAVGRLTEEDEPVESPVPASGGAPVPLDLGYLVIRAPERSKCLRGHHRCTWADLMNRLLIPRSEWPSHKAGFYIRSFRSAEAAEGQWCSARLSLPIPVDPVRPA